MFVGFFLGARDGSGDLSGALLTQGDVTDDGEDAGWGRGTCFGTCVSSRGKKECGCG